MEHSQDLEFKGTYTESLLRFTPDEVVEILVAEEIPAA